MAARTNFSFNEWYNLIKNKINSYSKKPTDWSDGSINKAFVQAIASFLDFLQLQINITYSSFRISTAFGEHLKRRVEDYGIKAKEATVATGIQVFEGVTGRVVDTLIPFGTTVSTQSDVFGNRIEFTTDSTIILPSGAVFVTGGIIANNIGSASNVPVSGLVNNMVDQLPNIQATYNYYPITNGADEETSDQLRARVPDHILGLKCANDSAIRSAALRVPSINVVKLLENHPAQGNFSVYVSNDVGVVDPITIAQVRAEIDQAKGLCVTYNVLVPTVNNITLSLNVLLNSDDYNQDTLKQLISITLFNYVNSIKRSTLYISDIVATVKKINGVIDCSNVLLNGSNSNYSVAENYVIKIASEADITINV